MLLLCFLTSHTSLFSIKVHTGDGGGKKKRSIAQLIYQLFMEMYTELLVTEKKKKQSILTLLILL